MKRHTLLLVDDDEDILEVEGSLLSEAGFNVLSTESIDEGLAIVESAHPDIVLLDLVFPEDTEYGLKAAHRLRSLHPDLPIFLLTALNREHLTGLSGKDTDFNEIIAKPVNFESLAELIRTYIR